MFEYRVTKYDPRKRDHSGVYLSDEWCFHAQIGQTFGGVVVTAADYQRTEDAYVATAMAFLHESGVGPLRIAQLQDSKGYQESGIPLHSGVSLTAAQVERVCRLNLQETIWCKLENGTGCFIHFGWDYYMYIGVPAPCGNAEVIAHQLGLFVELSRSPYHEIDGAEDEDAE